MLNIKVTLLNWLRKLIKITFNSDKVHRTAKKAEVILRNEFANQYQEGSALYK